MRPYLFAVIIFILCPLARAEEMLVANEFHVTKGGGFVAKTLKEMDSSESQAISTEVCTTFGINCSSAVGQVGKAAEAGTAIVGQAGSDVFITGVLVSDQIVPLEEAELTEDDARLEKAKLCRTKFSNGVSNRNCS